jgi:hypothetical protein
VWLPTNSPRSAVRDALGADTGAVVTVIAGTTRTSVQAPTSGSEGALP